MLMHLDGHPAPAPAPARSFPNRWILSRLNQATRAVSTSLEHYRFDLAAKHVYQFIWHEYCDWYLELIKPALSRGEGQAADSPEAEETRATLLRSFETLLRLLHPMMPFISEEIWQTIPHEGQSIVIQPYPEAAAERDDKEAEAAFGTLERFVTAVRTGRALLNYPPGKTLTLHASSQDRGESAALGDLRSHLEHLSRGALHLAALDAWPAARVLRLTVETLTVGLDVEGEVDLQKALDRILKQQEECRIEAGRVTAKLGNADFISRAPSDVVAEHETRLRTISHEQEMLASSEQQLRDMMRGAQA